MSMSTCLSLSTGVEARRGSSGGGRGARLRPHGVRLPPPATARLALPQVRCRAGSSSQQEQQVQALLVAPHSPDACDAMMRVVPLPRSFDIVKDELGGPRSTFPHCVTLVAGTQAGTARQNYFAFLRLANLGQGRCGCRRPARQHASRQRRHWRARRHTCPHSRREGSAAGRASVMGPGAQRAHNEAAALTASSHSRCRHGKRAKKAGGEDDEDSDEDDMSEDEDSEDDEVDEQGNPKAPKEDKLELEVDLEFGPPRMHYRCASVCWVAGVPQQLGHLNRRRRVLGRLRLEWRLGAGWSTTWAASTASARARSSPAWWPCGPTRHRCAGRARAGKPRQSPRLWLSALACQRSQPTAVSRVCVVRRAGAHLRRHQAAQGDGRGGRARGQGQGQVRARPAPTLGSVDALPGLSLAARAAGRLASRSAEPFTLCRPCRRAGWTSSLWRSTGTPWRALPWTGRPSRQGG